MAHKMMINGTVREAAGGKMMIDGTVVDIAKGKAMINGTVKEIAFQKMVTITITATNTGSYTESGSVKINGVTYKKDATVEVPAGTTITLSTKSNNSQYAATIKVDGITVESGGNTQLSYDLTVDSDVSITLQTQGSTSTNRYRTHIIVVTS